MERMSEERLRFLGALAARANSLRIAKLLEPTEDQAETRSCDLLIFVAVRSELVELLRCALNMGISIARVRGRESDYYDLGVVGRRRVLVVKTEMGPFSHGGSASRAIHCLTETGASGLICVGMAFGTIPARQEPGDVLVSRGVLAYDRCVVKSTDTTTSHHDYSQVPMRRASSSLLREFERHACTTEWQGRVHRGLILSGGAIIHCAEFRDKLARKCAHGKGDLAVGGEMEGIGLLSASPKSSPNWIIVKAISDFADHHRDEVIRANRPLACYNSARFVLETIADGEPHEQA